VADEPSTASTDISAAASAEAPVLDLSEILTTTPAAMPEPARPSTLAPTGAFEFQELLPGARPVPQGAIAMRQLPNGVQLLVKRNPSNRILAMSCYFNTGSYFERDEESGITNLVCRTMIKGTTTRTSFEIAEEIEAIGGELDAGAGEDFSEVSTISTVDDLDTALDLLADVILHPTFPEDEVEKERAAILAAIRRQEDSSFQYTYKNFRALLYGGHPYAKPVSGTIETVEAIPLERLAAYHAENFTAANLLIVVVGDVEPDAIARKLARALAHLPPGRPGRVLASVKFRPRGRMRTLSKEVEQAFVILGYPTERAQSADYVPLKVAGAVLGTSGSMSSRLFRELRDKQGLAYSVGSSMPTLRDKSHFFAYIGTKPGSVDEARDGLIRIIRGLATDPLPPAELERVKTYLIGQFRIAHQRNTSQADFLGLYTMVGLGPAFDEHYPTLIRQVTAQQVRDVAARYFRAPTIVILEPTPAGKPIIQRVRPIKERR
jgi:predicted Zn-dependent peptidase